ncbi:uncharacterized protein [Coffea arabica]|uniref:MULE transposase domain-containing protein n=1 Tax=Coffea arabica TaxID=13443 RepID=A0ABM4WP73_COFAR
MSGDDERNGKGNGCRDFNAAVEFTKSNLELKVRDKFKNLRAFKEALMEWNVKEGYTIKYKKNEKAKVIAMCKKGFVKTVRREIMVDISIRQAYRAKRLARKALQRDDMRQYHVIRDYAATLLIRNPGSHIVLQVARLDDNELLTAMGRDGNDNMIPMAIAVVEAKRYDSWKWFLIELKTKFGVENGAPWTFISDRQKGLVSAIDDVFLESEHRYCLRHIYQNFKKKFKGKKLKEYFWAAASTGNIRDFKTALAELERADPKVGEAMNAAGWLSRIPAHLWSRSHSSSSCKSDILVNNLNESFNSYILPAREFTIISMFEWIRRKLMQRLHVKREGMQKYQGNLCPNIQE